MDQQPKVAPNNRVTIQFTEMDQGEYKVMFTRFVQRGPNDWIECRVILIIFVYTIIVYLLTWIKFK